MNALSIIIELEDVVHDCIKEPKINLSNVRFVAKEAERILQDDWICRKHYKSEIDFTIKYLKSLQEPNLKHDELSNRFSKIILLKEKLQGNYFELLKNELQNEVFTSKDLRNVHAITIAFATQLILNGHSFSYLYGQKSNFLDSSKQLSFKEKFDNFLSDISAPTKEFRVVFKFSSIGRIFNVDNIFGISFYKEFVTNSPTTSEIKFQEQPGEIYGEKIVIASDPQSAVFVFQKSISFLHNLVRFEYRRSEFKISPQFLVYDNLNNHVNLYSAAQPPLGFISSGIDNRFKKYLDSFNKLTDPMVRKADGDSVERIISSFHYFRLSLDAGEPATRFLQNWIALEYLVKVNLNKGIIEKAIDFIPKLFVTQHLKKLLKDFAANLNRLRCDKNVLNQLSILKNIDGNFNLANLYEVLKDNEKKRILLNASETPLFHFRVEELHKIFTNNKNIENQLGLHLENMQWNLQRIYRVRNKIVHGAITNPNLIQLEGDLSEYYTTLLNNIIYHATNSNQYTNLESIYFKFESSYEFLISQVKNDKINANLILE